MIDDHEIKPYNVWTDETAPGVEFTHEEFMARLKAVHNINPSAASGRRQTVAHIDGDTWYEWHYRVIVDGKVFHNMIRTIRSRAFAR